MNRKFISGALVGKNMHPITRTGPDEELQAELYQPGTPLIGAVAYFPENYGLEIVPLVLQCLNGQPVPPASYAEHKLIAQEALVSSARSSRSSLDTSLTSFLTFRPLLLPASRPFGIVRVSSGKSAM
jgi:hypothetical protein